LKKETTMKKKKHLRPSLRRPSIPHGAVLKSRLDRRAKEKEQSWKKEWKARD
jgi:hypothetical protein